MFVDAITSLPTVEFERTLSVDVEAFSLSVDTIHPNELTKLLRNARLAGGGNTAVFTPTGAPSTRSWENAVGVLFIEDWRAQCFPYEVLDAGTAAREQHIETRFDKRKATIQTNAGIDDTWTVLRDGHHSTAGGGKYGQSQYFAIASEWMRHHDEEGVGVPAHMSLA